MSGSAATKPHDLIVPGARLPLSFSNCGSSNASEAGRPSTPSADNDITPVPQPFARQHDDAAHEFKNNGADAAKPKVDVSAEDDVDQAVLMKRGRRKVTTQKYVLTAGLIAVK